MGYMLLLSGCVLMGTAAILFFLFLGEANRISYEELRDLSARVNVSPEQEEYRQAQKRQDIIKRFNALPQQKISQSQKMSDHRLMELEDTLELARKRVQKNP